MENAVGKDSELTVVEVLMVARILQMALKNPCCNVVEAE